MAAKKSRKPSSRSKPKQSSSTGLIVVLIILVALIGVGVWFWFQAQQPSDYAALVNGEAISNEQLTFQYNLLPENYKQAFSREQVLEQIINEELMVQAARRQGITVSEQDINEQVQVIMGRNNMTINELQENLDQLNISLNQFEKLVERQLLMERYLNTTMQEVQVDDATLRGIYDLSLSRFKVPEQATVRHILVALQREKAAIVAKEIYDDVRSGADFCEYVKNNTDDRASIESCGEYTFAAGVMVPEFEAAAFDMDDGDFRMVQSQFGYHIIEKINMTPEHQLPFEAARDQLASEYATAEQSHRYQVLQSNLRASASIVYANGTVIQPRQQPSMNAEPMTGKITDEPGNITDDAEPEVIPKTTSVFSCIAESAVLYGTSWNTDTKEALALFSKQGVDVPYVACDKNEQECKEHGVQAYPTWVVDNYEIYVGRMSIEQLKDATGCS